MRMPRMSRRDAVFALLAPSVLLPLGLLVYWRDGSMPHFFLHALMGWNVGLAVLLVGAGLGRHPTRWDGFLPLALVVYAQLPDFIYLFGPYHRDWMDVFLFHIGLDEVLPLALAVLAPLWLLLFAAYTTWLRE